MGVLSTYQGRPVFPVGVPLDVTGGVDVLYANARAVDEASLLGKDALCAHAYRFEPFRANPLPYGQWSFQWQTGVTTLVWSGYNTLSNSVTERIRFRAIADPVNAPSGIVLLETALTAGAQTVTVATDLHTRGWSNGQIIEIHVEIYDSGATTPELVGDENWGLHETVDFYVTPLSGVLADAYPGVPTFTTGPDPDKLNQLAGALDWLARRIGVVPRPLFQSIAFGMTFGFLDDYNANAPIDNPYWSGGFARGQLDRLTALVRYECNTNIAEDFRLFVNGTLATEITVAAGQRGRWDPVVDISSYGASSPIRLEVRARTRTPGDPEMGSRLSVSHVRLYRAAPTPASMPAVSAPEESMTWATARARLATLASVATTVHTRLANDGETWNKARLYRQNYGYNTSAKNFFEARHIPVVWNRVGARLVARGKNVLIGYGAAIWTLTEPKYQDSTMTLKNAIEENLIDATGFQTRIVYLDGLKGLGLGTAYNVRGDVRYAAEHLL